jgi:hypothetical protein
MGIAVPRPAMRAKESRVIAARLRRFDELLKELLDKGVGRDEAKRIAFAEACRENPYRK